MQYNDGIRPDKFSLKTSAAAGFGGGVATAAGLHFARTSCSFGSALPALACPQGAAVVLAGAVVVGVSTYLFGSYRLSNQATENFAKLRKDLIERVENLNEHCEYMHRPEALIELKKFEAKLDRTKLPAC